MQNHRNPIYILISISLLLGLFTGRALFFNIAYLFVGIIIISYVWAWLSVRGISIGRKTRTRRSQVGKTFEESFSVRNTNFIPKLWLEVRDHSTLPDHRVSHIVPGLRWRITYQWDVSTPCLVRGEFRLGPLTIMSGDPFGLFSIPKRINANERIIVYPATVPLNKFQLPTGILSGGMAQRRISHNITTNASGIRDYVPGDSFNRIDWKGTARKNRILVKEFEIDPMVDIWLLIDFSRHSLIEEASVQRIGGMGTIIPTGQRIPASTEEYAAVIGASLTQHFITIERSLGFAAYTPHREVLQPQRGTHQLSRIYQILATARSTSNYTLAQTLALETPHLVRGTTLVIVTASTDTLWVQEAQILSRRGIRPMCVFIDPRSFGGEKSSDEIRGRLKLAKIPTIYVRKDDDLSIALQQRPIY